MAGEGPLEVACGTDGSGWSQAAILGDALAVSASGPTAGELGFLLQHERHSATQPMLEALLEQRSGDGPAPVRGAADRLVRENAPWALDIEPTIAALLRAAGDDRSRGLFVAWWLHHHRPTLHSLAQHEGISATRVSHIVQRSAERIRDAFDASPGSFRWLVAAVRRRLGGLTTLERADAALARLGVAGSPGMELVLWLAGPYHPVPGRAGWLATRPKLVVPLTSRCLSADGGVRRLVDVESELAELDVPASQRVAWFGACGAIVVHDVLVSVSGPLADVVERVLDAHGVARTVDEIEADLSDGRREVPRAALEDTLRGRRFVRTRDGGARLAAWAADEDRRAARKPSRRVKPRPAPALGAPSGGDRLWLWVRIDTDALHGADAGVPAGLVEGLGLPPLTRRTFSSRWGPVTLAHDGPQPTRGSVRAVALAAGARHDDTLLLGFSPGGDVLVEVRRATGPAAIPDGAYTHAPFPDAVTGGTP